MGHVAMLHHEDGHTVRGWGWEGLYTVPVTHPTRSPLKTAGRGLISWSSGGLREQGSSIWVFRCWVVIGGGPITWGWPGGGGDTTAVSMTHPKGSHLRAAGGGPYGGLAAGPGSRDRPCGQHSAVSPSGWATRCERPPRPASQNMRILRPSHERCPSILPSSGSEEGDIVG